MLDWYSQHPKPTLRDRVVYTMERLSSDDVRGFTESEIKTIVTNAICDSREYSLSGYYTFGAAEEVEKAREAINMKRQTVKWCCIRK
jgi:hypothetical protein